MPFSIQAICRLVLVAILAHLHLVRSEPEANQTLTKAPTALRFWFSQRPEVAVTTIKLKSDAGTAIALAPLAVDTGANAPLVAAIRAPLAPGKYSVNWRTTAMDGHPSTGTFDFVVSH